MCKKKNNKAEVPHVCELCEHAILINDEENILCSKKGIVSKGFKCGKYIYDPLKKIPMDIPKMTVLTDDDII
ncbi:MAG: hypothetical protein KBT31_01165 [Firmicutes bacterium]|nr:hypothetical protein [Candidatus Colimorpha enterica]